MMDFILVPLVVGIITLGIYKLFELFVCKKERIIMIEKLGDKLSMGILAANYLSMSTIPVLGSLSVA